MANQHAWAGGWADGGCTEVDDGTRVQAAMAEGDELVRTPKRDSRSLHCR